MYDVFQDMMPRPGRSSAFRMPTLNEQMAAAMRVRPRQPLTVPEEEESTLLGKTVSGLTYIGEMLSKPSRAVLGTASGLTGGEWGGGLLNLIPFSDTIGWTDPEKGVGGRDFLTHMGLPENKPGLFASPTDFGLDVLGFGLEVVTDPLTYVHGPLGALTKGAGKAASTAAKFTKFDDALKAVDEVAAGTRKAGRVLGTSPAAYLDEIREGTRGWGSFHIPFTNIGKTFGAGDFTVPLLGKKATDLAEMAIYGKLSPLAHGRQLFSKIVGGYPVASHLAGQLSKDRAFTMTRNMEAVLRDSNELFRNNSARLAEMFEGIKQSMQGAGDDIGFREFDNLQRMLLERVATHGASIDEGAAGTKKLIESLIANPALRQQLDENQLSQFSREMFANIDGMRRVKDHVAEKARDLGLNINYYAKDFMSHMFRNPAEKVLKILGKRQGKATSGGDNMKFLTKRVDVIDNMPGGTYPLQMASMDDFLVGTAGLADEAREETARKMYRFIEFAAKSEAKNISAAKLGTQAAAAATDATSIVERGSTWGDIWDLFDRTYGSKRGIVGDAAGDVSLDDAVSSLKKRHGEEFSDAGIFASLDDFEDIFQQTHGVSYEEAIESLSLSDAQKLMEDTLELAKTNNIIPTRATLEPLAVPGGQQAPIADIPPALERLANLQKKIGKVTAEWDAAEDAYAASLAGGYNATTVNNVLGLKEIRKQALKLSDDEFREIQKHYLYSSKIEPELKRMLEMGDIDAVNVKEYHKWFFDGLGAGDELMGRKIDEPLEAVGDGLVSYLSHLPKEVAETGLFNRTVIEDMSDYTEHMALAMSNVTAARNVLRKSAVFDDPTYGVPLGQVFDAVSVGNNKPLISKRGRYTFIRDYLDEAWKADPVKAKGLGLPQADELVSYGAISKSLKSAWETNPELAVKLGLPYSEDLVKPLALDIPYPPVGPEQGREMLAEAYNKFQSIWEETPQYARRLGIDNPSNLYDTEKLRKAEGMIRVHQDAPKVIENYAKLSTQQMHSQLGKLWDSYTTIWKGAMTLPAIAFYVRNIIDDLWRATMASGEDTYSPYAVLKQNLATVKDIAMGKDIRDLEYGAEFMSHQNTSHFLREMGQQFTDDKAVTSLAQVKQPWKDMIGTLRHPTKEGIIDLVNPLNTKSIRPETKVGNQNLLFETGMRTNDFLSNTGRYATYASLRKAGKSASQAKWLTDKIHYNYSLLKGGAAPGFFGDRIARRVIPFYNFLQQNIPYHFSQLANYPGGGEAQTLRLMNYAQRDSEGKGYVPSWVKEQAAIRWSGTDDEATYLRKFGLSIEDPLTMLQFKGGAPNLYRIAGRLLSQSHPVITAATKMFTGEDPYSGRQIKEMNSLTERATGMRSDMLDTLLTASPASRGINIIDQLMFSPKDRSVRVMDLLTGMKFSEYDAKAAKLADLSTAINEEVEDDSKARFLKIPYAMEGASEETERMAKLARIVGELKKQHSIEKKRKEEMQKVQ